MRQSTSLGFTLSSNKLSPLHEVLLRTERLCRMPSQTAFADVTGANNGTPVSPMVSEEAQKMLHDATELDYLTHIIIRMYENKR